MEGTIGYITLFAGNFAPRNWAYCAGQIINIQSNTALFSILGTTYGGNGQTTFALPDLRGRAAVGAGQGPGLSSYSLGQVAGTETTTLFLSQIPAHVHTMQYSSTLPAGLGATTSVPGPATAPATHAGGVAAYAGSANTALQPYGGFATMNTSGSSSPVSILTPYLTLSYIICQFGIFPARN